MAKVPGMDGAVDLTKLQRPRTFHETTFSGCRIGLNTLSDTNGVVGLYQLRITDPNENHIYVFGMNEEVRQDLIAQLMDLTLIGSPVEEEE